jgi:hypothetical protein
LVICGYCSLSFVADKNNNIIITRGILRELISRYKESPADNIAEIYNKKYLII